MFSWNESPSDEIAAMNEIDQKRFTIWSPVTTSTEASAYLLLLKIVDVSFPNFCILDPHNFRTWDSKTMAWCGAPRALHMIADLLSMVRETKAEAKGSPKPHSGCKTVARVATGNAKRNNEGCHIVSAVQHYSRTIGSSSSDARCNEDIPSYDEEFDRGVILVNMLLHSKKKEPAATLDACVAADGLPRDSSLRTAYESWIKEHGSSGTDGSTTGESSSAGSSTTTTPESAKLAGGDQKAIPGAAEWVDRLTQEHPPLPATGSPLVHRGSPETRADSAAAASGEHLQEGDTNAVPPSDNAGPKAPCKQASARALQASVIPPPRSIEPSGGVKGEAEDTGEDFPVELTWPEAFDVSAAGVSKESGSVIPEGHVRISWPESDSVIPEGHVRISWPESDSLSGPSPPCNAAVLELRGDIAQGTAAWVSAKLGYARYDSWRKAWAAFARGKTIEQALRGFLQEVIAEPSVGARLVLRDTTLNELRIHVCDGQQRYFDTIRTPLHWLAGWALAEVGGPDEEAVREHYENTRRSRCMARDQAIAAYEKRDYYTVADHGSLILGWEEAALWSLLSPVAHPVEVAVDGERPNEAITRLAGRMLALHRVTTRDESVRSGLLVLGWERAGLMVLVQGPDMESRIWITPPTRTAGELADLVLLSVLCRGAELRDLLGELDAAQGGDLLQSYQDSVREWDEGIVEQVRGVERREAELGLDENFPLL